MVTSQIGYMVQSFVESLKVHISEKNTVRYLLIGFLTVLVGVGIYFLHQWYSARQEQEAQYAFGVLLDRYNTQLDNEKADFIALANEFKNGYERYKKSALAPYFISFQADALIKAGNKKEALGAMDTLVDSNAHSSMTPLFNTKRALLALDSDNQLSQQKGLEELKKLGSDEKNIYRDYALYHLGMYHWVHDDIEQARLAWQELTAIEQGDIYSMSPWAALASEALQSLS